jgi:hypothetical protein
MGAAIVTCGVHDVLLLERRLILVTAADAAAHKAKYKEGKK